MSAGPGGPSIRGSDTVTTRNHEVPLGAQTTGTVTGNLEQSDRTVMADQAIFGLMGSGVGLAARGCSLLLNLRQQAIRRTGVRLSRLGPFLVLMRLSELGRIARRRSRR
jgi:hypothetical protein